MLLNILILKLVANVFKVQTFTTYQLNTIIHLTKVGSVQLAVRFVKVECVYICKYGIKF